MKNRLPKYIYLHTKWASVLYFEVLHPVYNTRSTGFSILFLEIHYQSQVKIMVAIYALAANKTMAVNKAMKTKLRKTYQGVDAWWTWRWRVVCLWRIITEWCAVRLSVTTTNWCPSFYIFFKKPSCTCKIMASGFMWNWNMRNSLVHFMRLFYPRLDHLGLRKSVIFARDQILPANLKAMPAMPDI